MELRKLWPQEEKLLDHLIHLASLKILPPDWKAKMVVEQMDDGDMGSLRMFPSGSITENRVFGKQVSEYQFLDKDGIPVIASLNVDDMGNLFELDIWKTDYSALLQLPDL